MALRNQPYFPLYTQDFISDEKLRECSAASVGVYIFLMCVFHKSERYGAVSLKPKDKKSGDPVDDFSVKLSKHLPFDHETIKDAIGELLDTGVLSMEGDTLFQKRMVHDGAISDIRATARKGKGAKTGCNDFDADFVGTKSATKSEQNSENEDEDENKNKSDDYTSSDDGGLGEETAHPQTPAEPPVYSLPLIDGTFFAITKEQFTKWTELYQAVDVMQELRKMDGWLEANPKKRKTKGGIMRFANGWLAREQDRGGSKRPAQKSEGGAQNGNAGQYRGNSGKGWNLQNDLSD